MERGNSKYSVLIVHWSLRPRTSYGRVISPFYLHLFFIIRFDKDKVEVFRVGNKPQFMPLERRIISVFITLSSHMYPLVIAIGSDKPNKDCRLMGRCTY